MDIRVLSGNRRVDRDPAAPWPAEASAGDSREEAEEELPESSVEITWGNMDYVYTDGIWNPAEHRYEGGGWTDNGSGCVTVKNTGDAAVETSFTYTTERADISGSFTAADDPVTGPVTVAGGEEQTVHLILDGAPSESLEEQTVIGNVSVTLGGS